MDKCPTCGAPVRIVAKRYDTHFQALPCQPAMPGLGEFIAFFRENLSRTLKHEHIVSAYEFLASNTECVTRDDATH